MGCCIFKLSSDLVCKLDDPKNDPNNTSKGCYSIVADILHRYNVKQSPSVGSTVSNSDRKASMYSDTGSTLSMGSWDEINEGLLNKTTPKSRLHQGFLDGHNEKKLPYGFSQFYEMKELIGVGTTSKCYRCVRRGRGIDLACKVIDKRRLAADHHRRQLIVEQLRQEVAVLRRLNHPNIVKLEDVIETTTYIFIVMEYVCGGELFDAILDRGAFSENDAQKILKSVVSALDYMHSCGIVHRDVKPENLLLVSKDRRSFEVKLIDFGFSKILNFNMTTSFLGTGGYLAPEIRQQKFYSSSVDVWALGVLAYLLLSGRLPFQTATELLSLHQSIHVHFHLDFPDEQWRYISDNAKGFIRNLLEIDPVRRYTAQQALLHPWLNKPVHSEENSQYRQRSYSLRSVQSLVNIVQDTLFSEVALTKAPSLEWKFRKVN